MRVSRQDQNLDMLSNDVKLSTEHIDYLINEHKEKRCTQRTSFL